MPTPVQPSRSTTACRPIHRTAASSLLSALRFLYHRCRLSTAPLPAAQTTLPSLHSLLHCCCYQPHERFDTPLSLLQSQQSSLLSSPIQAASRGREEAGYVSDGGAYQRCCIKNGSGRHTHLVSCDPGVNSAHAGGAPARWRIAANIPSRLPPCADRWRVNLSSSLSAAWKFQVWKFERRCCCSTA